MTIVAVHDVTPTQQAMLAAGSLDTTFVAQVAIDLVGSEDIDALRSAWQTVVGRHAILRTGFALEDQGTWLQFVVDDAAAEFVVLPDPEALDRHLEDDLRRPFDLKRAGLIRTACARVGHNRIRIAFTHHHAILDGWSLQLLIAELVEVYGSRLGNAMPRLAPAVDFGAFADWLETRGDSADEHFWSQTLGSLQSPMPMLRQLLPGEQGGDEATIQGKQFCDVDLGRSALDLISHAARRCKITPAAILHGLWSVVVGHLLDTADPVIGSTQSGRPTGFAGADKACGPFLVTLPVRTQPRPGQSVRDWFATTAQMLNAMQSHASFPAARIRGVVGGVPLGVPLFETVLAVQNYASGHAEIRAGQIAADLSALRIAGGEGRYPLLVGIALQHKLTMKLSYDPKRLTGAMVQCSARLLQALIGRLDDAIDEDVETFGAALPSEWRGAWRAEDRIALAFNEPQGPNEELICAIWSELAGRPIGRDEDFFESGSHSLLAVELGSRLSLAVGRRISVEMIYQARTIEGIAKTLANAPELEDDDRPKPLEPEAIGDQPFALTELQRAYWIGRDATIELGGRPSFATLEIALADDLTEDALHQAWLQLRARHAMLRAVITADGQQRIPAEDHDQAPRCWFSIHVTSPDPAELEAAARRLQDTIAAIVADAQRGPMFVLGLLTAADGNRRLFVAYDPIICDAGSMAVLTRELSVLARDPDAQLPLIEIAFSDYVRGLNALVAGPAGERDRAYWRDRVASLPPAPALPQGLAAHLTPAAENFRRRSLRIDPGGWKCLRDLAAQLAVTPTALLTAVYAMVIAEWSGNRHFCINLTLFNRQPLHPQVHALVGDFTSLTLLEVDLERVVSIVDAARIVHRRLAVDIDRRLVDGVEVMRWLSQAAGQAAVMPVVLTSTLGQSALPSAGPALGAITAGYGQTPQVYLDCQITEDAGALRCWWDSLDSKFPPGLIDTMFAAFEGALDRLAWPDADIDGPLVPLAQAETARRDAYNRTDAPETVEMLQSGFLFQADQQPDRVALISALDQLTYGEVERASRALAAQIRLVADPALPVAILTPCPLEMAIASLAILRAGRAFVRLSPEWPAARCEAVLSISGAALLLNGGDVAEETLAPGRCLLPICLRPDSDIGQLVEPEECPDKLAYIMFTSGSTGDPKGVAISHRAAINTIRDVNARLSLHSQDRVLAVSAATFDLSIYDLFGPLAVGGAVVFPSAMTHADADHWIAPMAQHAVTVWNSTPSLMQMLCDRLEMGEAPHVNLRAAMLSGDWIPQDLAGRIRKLWPRARVIGMGGATEAAIWSVWEEIGDPLPGWSSVPYGLPLANQTLDVLDARLYRRPEWAVGDLYIGGAGLADGYFARPDLTAAAFINHPVDGTRLYRTGDLARFRPDGRLEFLGRQDGQVKIRGYRIELGEIESLLSAEAGVNASLALVEGTAIHAFAVGAGLDPGRSDAMKRSLASRLPPYAVPATLTVLDRWPLTAHGKIDKTALLKMLRSKPGNDPEPCAEAAPLTGTVLAAVGKVIGRSDLTGGEDLFVAGMDSVSATQVIARIHADTGLRIPLALFFTERTAQSVAAAIEPHRLETAIGQLAGAAQSMQRVPASSMQERLWLQDQLAADRKLYIIPGAIQIDGPLEVACLCDAVADLIRLHDPLRSVFKQDRGQLVQHLLQVPAEPLQVVPLGAAAESWSSFAYRPFALDRDIPCRFRLLAQAPQQWRLELAIHHIATDAWSTAILGQDLARLYSARVNGRAVPEPLPASYRDFAVWERAQEGTAERDASVNWWRSTLAGLPSQRLPVTADKGDDAIVLPVSFDADRVIRLEQMAKQAGGTLYMAVLGVFAAALNKCGGPDDIVIASSVNGRERVEIEDLVGCFVNIVPHRISLRSAADLAAVIERACAAVISAFDHRALPFERIVAAGRSAGAVLDPPFAAMFVLQNSPQRAIACDGLTFTLPAEDMDGSRYPLHLHLEVVDDCLRGALRAAPGTCSGDYLARIAQTFSALVDDAGAWMQSAPANDSPANIQADGQPVQTATDHRSRLGAMLNQPVSKAGGA